MIEKDFDIPFIADLALREKQIQQNYRPVIAVHKWFARRPGTLFRGLLLSEFSGKPIRKVFYQANDLSDRRVTRVFNNFTGLNTRWGVVLSLKGRPVDLVVIDVATAIP